MTENNRQPEIGQQYSCFTTVEGAESSLAKKGEDEGEPVTLCISAECVYADEPAAVLCFDWRSQTGDSSSGLVIGTDAAKKLREVGAASVLLAGQPTKADELVTSCRSAIEALMDSAGDSPAPADDLLVDELLEKLRDAAATRKRAIIRHYVEMTTGIQFDEFRKVPQDNFRDVWARVDNLNLGADLLITCVGAATEPIIIRLDRWGYTHWEHHYSAIGEGAPIALGMLCLQPWDGLGHPMGEGAGLPSLMQCLYRTYEAKRAAHIANPSAIGEATGFQVLTRGEKLTITQEGYNLLQDVFNIKHRVPSDRTDALAPVLRLPEDSDGWLTIWDPTPMR